MPGRSLDKTLENFLASGISLICQIFRMKLHAEYKFAPGVNHLDCLNHAVFRHCGNYQLVAQNVRVYRFVVTRIDNQFFRADNIRQQRTCLNADGMSLVNAAATVSVNFLYQQRTEADSQKLNSGTYPEQRQPEFLGLAYHFLICLCPGVDAVVALKHAVPAVRGSECAAGKQNRIRFQH